MTSSLAGSSTVASLLLRSPQESLTSATCCHRVSVPDAASVDWVFHQHARAPSAVRWSAWLSPLCPAWKETCQDATTAWERWLRESSRSSLMWVTQTLKASPVSLLFFITLKSNVLPVPLSLHWSIRIISCLINQCHLCSRLLGWPEIGLMPVGSGKIRRSSA